MSWTDERVEKLKTLWEQGKSASEIAKELGNVTRNAVIGKVHRMGLQNRAAAADNKSKEPKKKSSKAKSTAQPEAEKKIAEPPSKPEKAAKEAPSTAENEDGDDNQSIPHVPAGNSDEISEEARAAAAKAEKKSKRLDLMQLTERTCKWPVGDPATDDFWFCGHPSQAGKPYCEAHVELAFQAPMSRRDRS